MITGDSVITLAQRMLDPTDFPGRWNPRRAIPADVEPAASAAAMALEDAGWWRRGSAEACAGGLVVASDGATGPPSLRFARELRDRSAGTVGPGDFLFSLPSSTSAVIGILFGLTEYQTTIAGGAAAGLRALRHALDLVELGRLERVLLVVLSAPETAHERVAVAWCLEGRSERARLGRLDCGLGADPPPLAIEASARTIQDSRLAAAPFLQATRWLEGRRGACLLEQVDPLDRGRRLGWLYLEEKKGT